MKAAQGDKELGKSKASSGAALPKMRRGPRSFFRDLQRESKMISWPTFKETNALTNTVIGVCFLVVMLLYLMSIVIDFFLKAVGVGG